MSLLHLFSEHRVVACSSHEEQHHYRQKSIGAAGQEGLASHGFRFIRDRGAVGGVVSRPLNETLLDAPDHSPDIEQHDPTDSSANADGKQAIALPSVAVPA